MTHEWEWNNNDPLDTHKAGLGAAEIQETRSAIFERMNVDHYMDGVLIPSSDQDGTHKVVTLKEQSSDPSPIVSAGRLYTKKVNGIIELFYINGSGNIAQLTHNGSTSFVTRASYIKYSTTVQRVLGTSFTTINFNNKIDSENGSLSSGIFIAQDTGFYSVCVFIEDSSVYGNLRLRKTALSNTTTIYEWPTIGGDGAIFFTIVWLEVDDSIFVEGVNLTINAGSYLEIIKI